MKKHKLIPLLALVAMVGLLCAALALLQGKSAKTEDETVSILLTDMTAEQVETVHYTTADGLDITLTRQGEGWTLSSDPQLTISASSVDLMLEGMLSLSASRQLEETPAEDMGFSTPAMQVELTGSNASFAFTVGSRNQITDTDYLQKAGEDTVYMVPNDSLSNLCYTAQKLYEPVDVTSITREEITHMAVQGGQNLAFDQDGDGNWILTDDATYPLAQNLVRLMANTVCDMQAKWTITNPETESAYGLDAPQVVVELQTADGRTETITFGNTDPADDGVLYLKSTAAPGVVLETDTENLSAYAYTKDTLYQATAETAQTAETAKDDVVAEYPIADEGQTAN